MATRDTIVTEVQAHLGNDSHLLDAQVQSWIQRRYEDLYNNYAWSQRLRDFVITGVAQIESTSTDEVTVTTDDATVTSAGTPFTSAMVGRQIQIEGELQYFFIASFTDSSNVELGDGEGNEVTWPHTTNASASWRIFKTIYTLPSTADYIVSMTVDEDPIEKFDGGRKALDLIDPDRSETDDEPRAWLYHGVNSSFVKEVELWPVLTQARMIRGQMRRTAPTLSGSTTIDLDASLLTYKVTADCANVLFAKTGDPAYRELSLFYAREYTEMKNLTKQTDRQRRNPSIKVESRGQGSLRGTDYDVDHFLPWR